MLAIYTFIPIFAPAIRLLIPFANGLVAQLNSALDYGSRGYWFESSQGHKTPTDVGVFFYEIYTTINLIVRRSLFNLLDIIVVIKFYLY